MPDAKGFGGRRRSRSDEPATLGEIVDGLMREEVFSRGMPIARLASRWPEIVGERMAAETSPAAFENGVLTVIAQEPKARTYLKLNAMLHSANSGLYQAPPFTLVVRENVADDEIRTLVMHTSTMYLRDA